MTSSQKACSFVISSEQQPRTLQSLTLKRTENTRTISRWLQQWTKMYYATEACTALLTHLAALGADYMCICSDTVSWRAGTFVSVLQLTMFFKCTDEKEKLPENKSLKVAGFNVRHVCLCLWKTVCCSCFSLFGIDSVWSVNLMRLDTSDRCHFGFGRLTSPTEHRNTETQGLIVTQILLSHSSTLQAGHQDF